MKKASFINLFTVIQCSLIIGFIRVPGVYAAPQTEATASVRMHKIGVGAHYIDKFDATDVDTGLLTASDWNGTINAQAKAHAEYRNLKAYSTISYSSGSTPLNFESISQAYYTDEIQFAPITGPIINPDNDYSVELAFHAGGSRDISGFFTIKNCVLRVSWSARGSNQEPSTEQEILGDEGDYRFTITGYRGDLIDLKIMLDATLYVSNKQNVSGQGTLDFFHTLTYTGATLKDSQDQVVAAFDADNNQTAGQPGWAVVPIQSQNPGVIFGLKSRSIGGGGANEYTTPVTLYSFPADGSVLNIIGVVTRSGTQIRADALACAPNGTLWCVEPTPGVKSTLYQINPKTAEVVSEGIEFPNRQIFGAAFDRRGQLWVTDETNDQLLRIDPVSGTILHQTALTKSGAPFDLNAASGDLCFDPMGNAYLVAFEYLYRLNVYTGALTELFRDTTPYSKFLVGAAIPANRPDRLFGFEVSKSSIDNDDIFIYNLVQPAQPNYVFNDIITSYNAGRGDLATVVPTDLIVESFFNTDNDGWTGAALSTTNLSQVVQSLPISYSEGHISVMDNDNQWTTFAAPAAYLGDKFDWLGGQIEFDMLHQTDGARLSGPSVFLVGNGMVLCSPWMEPTDSWQHYSVSLTPSGWHTTTHEGPEPSLETFYSVLSNLQAMYIIGDYVSGVETTSIDNVSMRSGLSPDSSGDNFINMEYLAQFAAQWMREDCAAPVWCDRQDFSKNGSVNMEDLYFLILNWLEVVR